MPSGGFKYDHRRNKAKDSPIGPGEITNVSMAGYPEVNGVAVAWLEFEDGEIFDPCAVRDEWIRRNRLKEETEEQMAEQEALDKKRTARTAVAERLVKALALAEVIPFARWREGQEDRAFVRQITLKSRAVLLGRVDNLEVSYNGLVTFVESVLETMED